jgi:TP901-1 family phage major tail protein
MTEAAKGIDQILLYRILEEAGINPATKLAFQTEHETTESKDSESVPTKDGNIVVPGQLETEISGTSILAKGDAMVKKLRDAMRNDKIVEVWEIDKGSAVPGAFEVDTLTISGAPSTAGEITLTLNGVAEKVVVLSTDTAAIVGDRIRNTNVAGWTVGGTGTTVTFTKNSDGTNTAPAFAAGTTGAAGAFVVTTAGSAASGKYDATYYQGYITEYSKSAGTEDNVEISFTYIPNGHGVDLEATLTADQAEVVQYLAKDTTVET